MSLVDNERVKLTATWLNTLASATFGVLAPLASFVYGLGQSPLSVSGSLVAMVIWFSAALALCLGARRVLGGLVQ
jgi:hypothetical protein